MKFSFWQQGHVPTASEVLVALGKVAGISFIAGLVGSLAAGTTDLPMLLSTAGYWAICGLSFYLFCGFPWVYLGPVMHRLPCSFRKPITALVGGLGSALALTLSIGVSGRFLGIQSPWTHNLGRVLWVEGLLGAAIALIIGAFRALQVAVTNAEAKVHEKEMRESQLAEAAAKAQAAALQSQINPHFFFNTLNTLSALIPAEAADAQEIVCRLADMFRYTLACSRADAVTLNQELEFTENYLLLEQARFRERLQITLPRGDFADIKLPGLSLQPLVENAIKYGVARLVEGGEVEVAVRRNGASNAIDVMSPGHENFDGERFFRAGHALENVRDRLRLFAGDTARVDVASEDRDRVRVSLVLPK